MDKRTLLVLALAWLVLAGCATPAETPSASGSELVLTPTSCVLEPISVPTPPAEIPPYTELDETTGLHVTGSIPDIDFETYRLEVVGKVGNPLSLSYDDLRCMPKLETHCILVCPGFFQDEATWAGVPLSEILDRAQVQEDATGLRLVGADGYRSYVPIEEAHAEEAILAYEWEGEPLPILHGFPVRAVFPELNGDRWVKWLIAIEVE